MPAMTLSGFLATTSFGFLLLCSMPCSAQGISAKVDEFINTEMRRQRIPGLSLAVIKDGQPILIKGYGFSNVEQQVPVKPETVFQSGSIGKQFTATAVMILVEEGKLSLDDKISKYFREVPETWKNITSTSVRIDHNRCSHTRLFMSESLTGWEGGLAPASSWNSLQRDRRLSDLNNFF